MIKPHTINAGVAICDQANTTPQEARDSIPASPPIQPVLAVLLPVPLARSFDYLCLSPVPDCLQPGLRVRVNFAGRQLVGLIQRIHTSPTLTTLKTIEALLDTEPVLPADLWQLLHWASRYYHHPIGEVFFTALPVLVRAGQPLVTSAADGIRSKTEPDTAERAARLSGRKLLALWQQLQQQGWLELKACRAQGFGVQIRRLLALDLIEHSPKPPLPHSTRLPPPLTAEQQQVLQQIGPWQPGFRPMLLQGITGSGKTELYLRLLDDVLAQGRQALVLIPEIGLTSQTLQRFQAALNYPMVCLNSSMTDSARLDAWLAARNGQARLVLGTRSALFTPMPDLGLIIIDEEHDASFRQQDGFRYSARDLALVRARDRHIPLLAGSATPSFESLAQAWQQRSLWLQLNQRATGQSLARMQLLDIRSQRLQQGFSETCLSRMQTELAQGNQVLVFLNRRGFAPQLLCHACGLVIPCSHCDVSLTLHLAPTRLSCHHCGRQQRPPSHCPDCGSSELLPQGLATAGLEQALAGLLPEARILRIDRDSTRRKGELDASLAAIQAGQYNLLIGTQMLAKGHHFPRLSLVVVLDADAALFSSDFRASERLAQLLIQVAGRAGREGPGQVLIQTRQPDHDFWPAILRQDYLTFARHGLEQRRQAMLPPFSHLALIRAQSRQPDAAAHFLDQIATQFATAVDGLDLLGPAPAPLARKDNQYRWQLLLIAPQRQDLHRLLARIAQTSPGKGVSWSLEVDPQELG